MCKASIFDSVRLAATWKLFWVLHQKLQKTVFFGFPQITYISRVPRGWAKQKSESSGHFRNLVNYLFWHNSSIVQLVLSCRNCSLNRFCMLLCFGRVHVRMSCIIWNKCTEKRKSIPALPEFFANINSLNSEIWMSMTRIRILILISDICSCFMK